jgi:glycosyltransferase involved in cell wall biosynthesis
LEGNVATFHLKDVGIVLIGRNEGPRLILAIEAAQRHCERVVYVDSASTDGSSARARALGVIVVELSRDVPMTAARGRRTGMEHLLRNWPDCRFVQFIDGDCIIQPSWLDTAHAFLTDNPQAAVVCGRRFEADPTGSFYNHLINQEWDTPIGQSLACGGDSMMRVEAVNSANSFRADLRAGEEPELCARLRAKGWQIWRLDAPMSEHHADINRFAEWQARAERGGYGYAQVWHATRGLPHRLYGRQIVSALSWALGAPLVALIASIVTSNWSYLLACPIAYVAQILRIASRRGGANPFGRKLRIAAVTMLVKFSETKGVFRYWLGSDAKTSYKTVTSPHRSAKA